MSAYCLFLLPFRLPRQLISSWVYPVNLCMNQYYPALLPCFYPQNPCRKEHILPDDIPVQNSLHHIRDILHRTSVLFFRQGSWISSYHKPFGNIPRKCRYPAILTEILYHLHFALKHHLRKFYPTVLKLPILQCFSRKIAPNFREKIPPVVCDKPYMMTVTKSMQLPVNMSLLSFS